jgi:hypothetical protein
MGQSRMIRNDGMIAGRAKPAFRENLAPVPLCESHTKHGAILLMEPISYSMARTLPGAGEAWSGNSMEQIFLTSLQSFIQSRYCVVMGLWTLSIVRKVKY